MVQSKVLILGGGIGGVAAANALRKLLPPGQRIVLVDREASFTLAVAVSRTGRTCSWRAP